MNSGIVGAGTDGCTSMMLGTRRMPATGAMSDEIEIELFIECRVERGRRTDQKKRISVSGCAHDGLGGDIAASTRPVLDDEWLTEMLKPMTNQARDDVGHAARRHADHQTHRPRWIGLRSRDARRR